jgi:hypothetical protein
MKVYEAFGKLKIFLLLDFCFGQEGADLWYSKLRNIHIPAAPEPWSPARIDVHLWIFQIRL